MLLKFFPYFSYYLHSKFSKRNNKKKFNQIFKKRKFKQLKNYENAPHRIT